MHILLERLLGRRGIKEEELDDIERANFDKWQKVLSNDQISVERMREFFEVQKQSIEAQFGNIENSSQKNDRLVLLHSVYSRMIRATVADKAERESLERYLDQLIDS